MPIPGLNSTMSPALISSYSLFKNAELPKLNGNLYTVAKAQFDKKCPAVATGPTGSVVRKRRRTETRDVCGRRERNTLAGGLAIKKPTPVRRREGTGAVSITQLRFGRWRVSNRRVLGERPCAENCNVYGGSVKSAGFLF